MDETALVPQFHAVAVNATEMMAASASIQMFLRNKLASIESEIAEAQEALDSAVKHKWKSSTFRGIVQRRKQEHLYYGKLLAASEAGFTIVPNMDVSIFAIRTKKNSPKWGGGSGTGPSEYLASPSIPDEEEDRLPVGAGSYHSIDQKYNEAFHHNKDTKDGKDIVTCSQFCEGFDDIAFPLAAAHPAVMDATARAMAMKIFDRIGIAPAERRKTKGDPIIIGQITRKVGWKTKTASFLIAWYLDPRTL